MRMLDEVILKAGKEKIIMVDLGGTRSFWEMNLQYLEFANRLGQIDIYNLDVKSEKIDPLMEVTIRELQGDATHLSNVDDSKYDIAFSNSVIEHVGNLAQQYRFAKEIRRIAPYFILQTPNRHFPFEPHFYVPFFQLLPLAMRAAMHRRFKLGWLDPEPDPLLARVDCDQIRLLTRHELKMLFPNAEIHREWLGYLVKSFIVLGGSTR